MSARGPRPQLQQLRVVAGVSRIEAVLLLRSLLLIAGVVGGAALFWQFAGYHEPLWWTVSWQIGHGQLVLSTTALIAGQLAGGRVRRNGLTPLYDSFPTSASVRMGGQFTGLVGVLPATAAVLVVAAGITQLRMPIGSPDVATLAAGVLLVIASGAIGVALGTAVPHPLAGVVAALVWLLLYGQSNQFNGTSSWLFPWLRPQVEDLPHPVSGYPPAVAHAIELAGIALLGAACALAFVGRGAKQRVSAALVGVVAVAAIGGATVAQLRPVPTSTLDKLVADVTDPASVQQCTSSHGVRYCLYKGFEPLLPALRGPVEAVIAQLPGRPAQPLTVRQTSELYVDATSLTAGHSAQQIARWDAELLTAPQNAATTSTLFLPVGAWPAASRLAAGRFDLALDTAAWAVGLPSSIAAPVNPTNSHPSSAPAQCVALDEAREAVAIYLALRTTHIATAPANPRRGVQAFVVDGTSVVGWRYPGAGSSSVIPFDLALTDQGYLLAEAMTKLPAGKVAAVLRSGWTRWLDWHTTDTKLAAALGISLPTAPSLLPMPPAPHGPGAPPQNPRCT